MRQILRALTHRMSGRRNAKTASDIPVKGFLDHRYETKFVDALNDDDLSRLNALLPWHAFTVDAHGRRFGNTAWEGKRDHPEIIPDRRVLLLHERIRLSDEHVLEVGCFEGIHTIALSEYARKVTAIDVRIENVVKTIVRCAMFGYHPTVFKCNIEERPLEVESLRCDIAFHVGVLYHLEDPVGHLVDLVNYTKKGVLLDTHYAQDDEATEHYEVGGTMFRYKKYQEFGYADPFSGIYDHAKWLRLDDITMLLRRVGFGNIDFVETRQERNGPRVLLIATRA